LLQQGLCLAALAATGAAYALRNVFSTWISLALEATILATTLCIASIALANTTAQQGTQKNKRTQAESEVQHFVTKKKQLTRTHTNKNRDKGNTLIYICSSKHQK
jgi:cobalamin biosynthesis protein CobD/CbiB